MTLTKVYCMTHPYQTLLREITTPTLPGFVTSCLNLVSSKSPTAKSSPLLGVVLCCMATLLPCHTTVFRPFVAQTKEVVRPFLAPTQSDCRFVSSSVKTCARRLVVLLHQTAPKNTGGEEWGKALREVVKQIHGTADHVFRAVVEDWESSAGYTIGVVDVNQHVSGGGSSKEDLPRWSGIAAGVRRLVGLLELLQEYFKAETPYAVSIPLGSIFDVITRLLSLQMPSSSSVQKSERGRLHPAIDRDEKDGLWCGLPQIYVAALQVVDIMAQRLEEGFMPMAQGSLDQVAWVFASGKHAPDFRLVIYQVVGKLLSLSGPGLDKAQASALFSIVRSACDDAQGERLGGPNAAVGTSALGAGNISKSSPAGPMPQSPLQLGKKDGLCEAANAALPIFMSHIPQEHVDICLRSLMERTAILTHNKEAMLASVLHPFLGRGAKAMPSIVPHLTRAFPHDAVTEMLLRPRMPLVPAGMSSALTYEADVPESTEDAQYDMQPELNRTPSPHPAVRSEASINVKASTPGLGMAPSQSHDRGSQVFGNPTVMPIIPSSPHTMMPASISTAPAIPVAETTLASQHAKPDHHDSHDVNMTAEASDSDDESVHLTMELDTDSDDD